MNLEKIKTIINSVSTTEAKEYEIIKCLAEDERVVPLILQILSSERETKKEVIERMNFMLSKADTGLEDSKFNKGHFIEKEIYEFFRKYRNVKGVGHCFKNLYKQFEEDDKNKKKEENFINKI